MKIQETNLGQLFMTLPKKIMGALGWKKGDSLELMINKDKMITLRKED